ncbi:MAG: hypothetical protein ACI85I_000828 [Arenicella sp.]|jgi:hypothetical protein
MKDKLGLIIKVTLVVIFVIFALMGIGMSGEGFMSENMINLGIVYLVIATVGAVFLDLILTLIKEPRKLVKPLVALVAVVVLFVIGYAITEGGEYVYISGGNRIVITSDVTTFVGAALTTTYVLSAIAILSIVVGEASKIFK